MFKIKLSYKHYIVFLSLIAVGLAAFFVISSGYYPIMSVNGEMVSARTFWKNYKAGSSYYQNFIKIYKPNLTKENILSETDLKRSILTQIIENNLIDQEVRRELGKDLDLLVSNKIDSLNDDAELKKAARTLYGLPFADFEKEILVPLAKQEILAGRLFLDGENLENWLKKNKETSEIKIFSKDFYWDGSEVQVSK